MKILEKPIATNSYKLFQTPPVIIEIEPPESAVEIATRIAVDSIINSPIASGMGVLAEMDHKNEARITHQDLQEIIKQARNGKISIDYWKGKPIKLTLRIENNRVTLDTKSWMDRWDWSGWEGQVA